MNVSYSLWELALYFLIYSFLGWVLEVAVYAVLQRRFFDRGFLSLPLLPSYGIAFDLLLLVLPTFGKARVLQFLAVLIVVSVTERMADQLVRQFGSKLQWDASREQLFSGSGKGVLISAAIALGYYLVYLVIHPLLLALVLLLPPVLIKAVVVVLLVLLAVDFASVVYAVRTGDTREYRRRQEGSSQWKLVDKITDGIWARLQRAYPGIRTAAPEEVQGAYTFAKGLCLDKLIWVFLVSALLGDIIETFYCGLVDGQWMNRSSVLYGPFSFVWGFGAVVLTVTLQRLAEKNDRYVFAAGFVIGGAYEYMCSVITELVFGTVFWDYSDMPLNIGGRTNVLFCFFWGVLALVWIKMIYPPMSKGIERLPALAGKVATWIVVFFMVCNGVLTCAAMLRYNTRAVRPQPGNIFEEFLDGQYGDGYIESRWPNMIVVEE